jgi:hypothetical protein
MFLQQRLLYTLSHNHRRLNALLFVIGNKLGRLVFLSAARKRQAHKVEYVAPQITRLRFYFDSLSEFRGGNRTFRRPSFFVTKLSRRGIPGLSTQNICDTRSLGRLPQPNSSGICGLAVSCGEIHLSLASRFGRDATYLATRSGRCHESICAGSR